MVSGPRPRPRARKISVDHSPIESLTSTVKSPLSPPPSARIATNSNDDDFFTKRRVATGLRTESAPALHLNENLLLVGSDDEHQFEEQTIESSSDDEGRRKKKARRKMTSWSKSASFSKGDIPSRRASSSQDEASGEGSRRASRSPSLTPPPALGQDVLDRLHAVLEQHNPLKPLNLVEEEDEDISILDDAGNRLELDPDLARMIKGDRAREVRKLMKEREARQRLEDERNRRTEAVLRPEPQTNVIEVEDSDDEPPIAASHKERGRMSSSPIEIVSSTFQTRTMAPIAASPPPVKEASPVDETERIAITMKGGEGGTLQSHVQVKPTTQVKKLLDHFKEMHKAAIPKGKLRLVRIRFDGENIDPSMTVGDVGIEDEEQIDVVW